MRNDYYSGKRVRDFWRCARLFQLKLLNFNSRLPTRYNYIRFVNVALDVVT